MQAVSGTTQPTHPDISREHLGTCGAFDERQIGGERCNMFEECPRAKICTLVLRGCAEQFIKEIERSLHDAIMVAKQEWRGCGGRRNNRKLSAFIRIHAHPSIGDDCIHKSPRDHSKTDMRQRGPRFHRHSQQIANETCQWGEMVRCRC
ncbi:hypothetical protein BD779DRAFT_68672 [Infundibulicybe gibba]|nr:hypothetical protein BD779DRAFT_68672 [Infundibulicybe gibba]